MSAIKLDAEVSAVSVLQRYLRGYRARVLYNEMLWASFQEEEAEQRALERKHTAEGLDIVAAAQREQEEAKEQLIRRSDTFVETAKKGSAVLVLTRVLRMKALARRAKAEVARRRAELGRSEMETATKAVALEKLNLTGANTGAVATTLTVNKMKKEADADFQRNDSKSKLSNSGRSTAAMNTETLPGVNSNMNSNGPENATPKSTHIQSREVKWEAKPTKATKLRTPPIKKTNTRSSSRRGKQDSKSGLQRRLKDLHQRREKLIRNLARALKNKSPALHQIQKQLKDISVHIQELQLKLESL